MWFLSSVNQGVLLQITLLKKGLLAQKAFISFVSTVIQFVSGKVFFLHKCLWAFVTSIVKCHLSSEFQYFIYEVECCSKVQTLLELPVATNQAYNFPFHNLHSLATLTQGREAEEQL